MSIGVNLREVTLCDRCRERVRTLLRTSAIAKTPTQQGEWSKETQLKQQ